MANLSPESLSALASESVRAIRRKDFVEAVNVSEQILLDEPNNAGALAIKFAGLLNSGRSEEARQMGGLAARLNPDSIFILNNQACLQLEANQPAAAAGLLRSLIDQYGEKVQWLYNLALAQRAVGNFDKAIDILERTIALQADHDKAAFQLADCLLETGRLDETVSAFDYLRLLRSNHASSHAQFIHHAVTTNYLSPKDLELEMALWQQRFVPSEAVQNWPDIQSRETINLAVFVGGLPESWLQSIVVPVLNELADQGDKVTIYSYTSSLSSLEALGYSGISDNIDFEHCKEVSDGQLAKMVRLKQTDIILDVAGMRFGNRQRVLGLGVASREYGWLAHEGMYPNSKVGIIENAVEQTGFVAAPAATTNAQNADKTFFGIGCGQGLSRMVISSWAEILDNCDGWKLHLDSSHSGVNEYLKAAFEQAGVSLERIVLDPLQMAGEGSIVLDNFLSNDPVALSNAVSRGAVAVCTRGRHFPAQRSAKILEQVNRPDWLTAGRAEYIDRAIALATSSDTFSAAKPISSQEIQDSKLHDIKSFCYEFRNTLIR